jgi:hypothetical protein
MRAFVIHGQDNDSYAFRAYPRDKAYLPVHQTLVPDMSGVSHPHVKRCETCGELTSKWDETLLGLVIKKRKWDISTTYDGVTIATHRFKSIYHSHDLSGLVFRQLPDDRDFFAINALKVVEFDAERRMTRFINPCPQCGHYESVVGATPVFLKEGSDFEPKEFVRTDLEFGSIDEKHPLLICGEFAAKTLSDAKLKGLDLSPIDAIV